MTTYEGWLRETEWALHLEITNDRDKKHALDKVVNGVFEGMGTVSSVARFLEGQWQVWTKWRGLPEVVKGWIDPPDFSEMAQHYVREAMTERELEKADQ